MNDTKLLQKELKLHYIDKIFNNVLWGLFKTEDKDFVYKFLNELSLDSIFKLFHIGQDISFNALIKTILNTNINDTECKNK